MNDHYTPFIVGIGGTIRPNSSTERVLAMTLKAAEGLGARTRLFGGAFMARLPYYDPSDRPASDDHAELIAAIRSCDGLVIGSPGYHGSVSGLVKNALDSLEPTSRDARPYLEGRAIGLITTVSERQAAGTTLAAIRSIVHALRGWPTPLGVSFNSAQPGGLFDETGALRDPEDANQIALLARQIVDFARSRSGQPDAR